MGVQLDVAFKLHCEGVKMTYLAPNEFFWWLRDAMLQPLEDGSGTIVLGVQSNG
jgi:hypothetical protein